MRPVLERLIYPEAKIQRPDRAIDFLKGRNQAGLHVIRDVEKVRDRSQGGGSRQVLRDFMAVLESV